MGVTYCPRHGRSWLRETCAHLSTEFEAGCCPRFHRLTYWLNALVCDECWERYDLARLESHPEVAGRRFYDADEDGPTHVEYCAAYESIERSGHCVKCLAELQPEAADFSLA